MATTKIEWADKVWNPVTGCNPVSDGCQNCYAARMAKRLRGRCGYPRDDPFRVTFHPDRIKEPYHWRKPQRIFVCSMGDLFHPDVQWRWLQYIFGAIKDNPKHTFMILTKRAGEMAQTLSWETPGNVWLGVSVEDQKEAKERIPVLLSIPVWKCFVSVEPMLMPVDLRPWLPRLDWVIAGPETGPGARACKTEWIETLWGQCRAAGKPFFDKRKKNWLEREWPK